MSEIIIMSSTHYGKFGTCFPICWTTNYCIKFVYTLKYYILVYKRLTLLITTRLWQTFHFLHTWCHQLRKIYMQFKIILPLTSILWENEDTLCSNNFIWAKTSFSVPHYTSDSNWYTCKDMLTWVTHETRNIKLIIDLKLAS